MPNIRMKLLDVPDISEQDWHDFIAIRSEYLKELNPDEPVRSYENQRIEYSSAREWENLVQVWLAYDEQDTCVGFFSTTHPKLHHPDYETTKNNLWIEFFVSKAHRRQGIAKHMLKTVIERARFFGATMIYSHAEVEIGHTFAEALGAQEALAERISRMSMADVDWDMMQSWVDAGKTHNPDVEIIRVDGLPPEEDIEAYCQFLMDIAKSVPREDIEDEDFTMTPDDLRKTHERNIDRGDKMIVFYAKDKDGSLMGLTGMFHMGEIAMVGYVGLTGVLPKYQRRGLGKYLKALMAYDVRDNFPKVQYTYTTNAEVNAPMLSINIRMGFKPYKHRGIYKIAVDDLEAKV